MNRRNATFVSKSLRAGTLAVIVGLTFPVYANAPTVTILSPTTGNTIFAGPTDFPLTVPVSFRVNHYDAGANPPATEKDMRDVGEVKVSIARTAPSNLAYADIAVLDHPWKNGSSVGCNPANPASVTSCGVTGNTQGNATVSWSATGFGTYSVKVTAKHASTTGQDEETGIVIAEEIVSVEWPAPPAIANAYINANYRRVSATQRGCIIKKITERDHLRLYGERPGPYNNTAIQTDVELFRGDSYCPTK
jgi:hypothetical protein